MGSRRADAVRQGLSKLAEAQAAALTDAELLRHFAATRDDEAFAALLRRHGGLVYSVCRNVLRHEHDAQDAFQATFLVLARRAGAIRDDRALGGWLYRVAYRVAVRARTAADRRRRQEARAARPEAEPPRGELAWRELQAMLDEELYRLPEKYRAPFVLCVLAGRSKSEAAAELGWKEGTVSSRLAQARAMLQARLARRGVALTAVLSGLAISDGGALAVVPPALLAAARASAVAFAGGEALPAGAAAAPVHAARAVLWRMALSRFKPAAAFLALCGLVGTAAAVALHRPPEPEPPPVAVAAPPPARAEARVEEAAPAPARTMTVSGFVVGPDGKRVPGARVVITAGLGRQPGELHPGRFTMRVLGDGRADDQGQYRVAATQTTTGDFRLTALALAPGYAPGSRNAEPTSVADAEHTLPVFLGRGRAVTVRLLDPEGRPAAGARVHLLGLYRNEHPGVYVYYDEPPAGVPGWPDPGTADERGVVTVRDVAPGTDLTLQVRDDRYAPQWLRLRVPPEGQDDPAEWKLSPPRVLEGRVTGEGTGEPLAGARVVVDTAAAGAVRGYVVTQTDADGRFRVRPFPGDAVKAWVYPPPDRPYLDLLHESRWPAGAAAHRVELSPLRGVLVRGTVAEDGSGRRVAGAVVTYRHRTHDPDFQPKVKELWQRGGSWQVRDARTGPDGTFALAVPPGAGTLLVKAAEPDYLHAETSSEQLAGAGSGGWPLFPDALVPLAAEPAGRAREVTAALRRGVIVRGRVVGDRGRPVAAALLFCPSYLPEGTEVHGFPLPVRDGRFEVPGCDPGKPVAAWVYDPRMREGAVARFTAGADEPEVRLAPCVAARVRVVDRGGKPLAMKDWEAWLVFRPGDEPNLAARKGTRARLSVPVRRVNGINYRHTPAGDGAVVFPDLIPGASYYLSARVGEEIPSVLTTFTAPPAGTLDLGDVTLDVIAPVGPGK